MIRLASTLAVPSLSLLGLVAFHAVQDEQAPPPPAPVETPAEDVLPGALGRDPALASWTWVQQTPTSEAGSVYSAPLEQDDELAAAQLIAQLPDWFAAQDRHLEAWFGESEGAPAPTLLLFQDPPARQLAMVTVPPGGIAGSSTRYLPDYNAIFSDLDALAADPVAWREGLLAERAAARLQSRVSEQARLSERRWILDAAALLLSGGGANSPGGWTETVLGPARARSLFLVLNKLDTASRWWLDPSAVLDLRGPSAAQRHGAERYGTRASDQVLSYVSYQAAGQAGLLSDWMFGLEGGQQAWLAFARAALEGTEDPASLERALGFESREALLRAFHGSLPDYFLKRHRRRLRWIDPEDPSGKRAQAATLTAEFERTSEETVPEALLDAGHAESFEFTVIGVREHHALAIGYAAEGNFARALQVLDQEPEPRPGLLARERERLEALTALREQLLLEAVEAGRKLRYREGDEIHVIQLTGREGDRFAVKPPRTFELEQLQLLDFTPQRLADNLGRRLDRTGDPASGVLAALLAGDSKALAQLKDGEPDRGLREDASHILERLEYGITLAWLEQAYARQPAATPLEDLQGWLRTAGELEELGVHRGLLIERVRADLAVHSSLLQPRDFLQGDFQPAENGRFLARYEFENPAELEDWILSPDWVWTDEEHAGYAAPATGFEVADGVLRCRGRGAARWKFGVLGPFEVRWSVRIQPGPVENRPTFHALLHGSQNPLSYASAGSVGDLRVYRAATKLNASESLGEGPIRFMGRPYSKSFGYSGSSYVFEEQDRAPAEIPAPPPVQSDLIWRVYTSDPVEILQLEVEGRLDPESLESLRRRWVAEQLAISQPKLAAPQNP